LRAIVNQSLNRTADDFRASHAETEVGNAFCLIEPTEAALPKYSIEFGGTTYQFCCSECVEMFKVNPGKYLDAAAIGHAEARSGLQAWFDGV
jgi:YHS domain-containing protein